MKKLFATVTSILVAFIFVISASAGQQTASVDNEVEQEQAQGQNQAQSQNQNQANQQILSLTQEANEAKVGFGPPVDIMFPGLVGNYVTPKMPGPLYTKMSALLYAKDLAAKGYAVFTRGEIEAIAEKAENWLGNTPGVMSRLFGGTDLEAVDIVKVSLMRFPYKDKVTGKEVMPKRDTDLKMEGMIYSKSTEDDETTLDILALALREAMDKGITNVQIMAEGVQVVARVKGFGVGFNTSAGYVNNDTTSSAGNIVGGGGTGWSSSEAKNEQHPYIQMGAYVAR